MVFIKLEEVLWEPGLARLLFNLNYGTKDLPTFIKRPYLGVRKMVSGMPEFNMNREGVCQGCVVGKLTRGPFPSSESQTTDILQLVHSDLFGMLPVTSLGGYLYYVIFVDDFSCKTWIYFLKKKDEVFKWFVFLKPWWKTKQ